MRKITLAAFTSAILFSGMAVAQDATVSVDLSSISVDLANELNIDVDDVPETIELSADFAAAVCDVDVATIGDSCVAVLTTADLLAALEDDEDSQGPSANSAREFAPGQQDGPAKDSAPGQQDSAAKDSAPGQMKKDDGGGEEEAPAE